MEFLRKIYRFLGLKDLSFRPSLIDTKVLQTRSKSAQSKIPFISAMLFKMGQLLNRYPKLKSFVYSHQLMEQSKKIINFNRKIIFAKNPNNNIQVKLEKETQLYLYDLYKGDIENLETLLNVDLTRWKITN